MIGGVDGRARMLMALQNASTARLSDAGKRKDASTAAPWGKPADPENEKLRQTLDTLRRANENRANERKGAARQKIDRLKRELQNLRMFSGGDPKAMARQAARIARELAAAAREYASTGGGESLEAGAPIATAPAAQYEEAQTPPAPAAEAQTPEDEPETSGSGEPSSEGAVAEGSAAQPETPAAVRSSAEELQDFKSSLQKEVDAIRRRGEEADADAKFAAEVRSLYNQLKTFIEELRRRAARDKKGSGALDQFANDLEQAGKQIDQALSGLQQPFTLATPPGIAVDISV